MAHDEKKTELRAWVGAHLRRLRPLQLFATGQTGSMIREAYPELDLTCLKSGPLGGDQQLGGLIAEGRIDGLVFFIDPLSPHPHDVDVKALIRVATLQDIPLACNRATADCVIRRSGAEPKAMRRRAKGT